MSINDQYCPVAPCLDIFPLKLNLNILKSDLDAVENQLHASMQVCKYEAIQVYKYAKWKLEVAEK